MGWQIADRVAAGAGRGAVFLESYSNGGDASMLGFGYPRVGLVINISVFKIRVKRSDAIPSSRIALARARPRDPWGICRAWSFLRLPLVPRYGIES